MLFHQEMQCLLKIIRTILKRSLLTMVCNTDFLGFFFFGGGGGGGEGL